MQSFFDFDDAVCTCLERGDFQGARRILNEDEGILSRRDKERLLTLIREKEASVSTVS